MSGGASWESVLGTEEGALERGADGSPDVTNISSDSEPSPVIVEAAKGALGNAKATEKPQDEALPPPPPRKTAALPGKGQERGVGAAERLDASGAGREGADLSRSSA
eukprot:1480435-Rhodomonas_salina.1